MGTTGMTAGKLAAAVAPLLPRLELDAAGVTCMHGVADAAQGVLRLEHARRFPDAIRLAAHALPKREAVWWACMAARAVPARYPVDADADALEAAEAWVRQQDEPGRYRCMELAMRSGCRGPEAWAAVAAFWSGGSIAPAGVQAVKPAAQLTGAAVTSALTLAAVRDDPAQAASRYSRFLAALRDIAAGGAGRIPVEDPIWN